MHSAQLHHISFSCKSVETGKSKFNKIRITPPDISYAPKWSEKWFKYRKHLNRIGQIWLEVEGNNISNKNLLWIAQCRSGLPFLIKLTFRYIYHWLPRYMSYEKHQLWNKTIKKYKQRCKPLAQESHRMWIFPHNFTSHINISIVIKFFSPILLKYHLIIRYYVSGRENSREPSSKVYNRTNGHYLKN